MLYLRFIRKVDQGRIRTLCPIMDILCSVGCLLKMMMSPSHMCLSTYKGGGGDILLIGNTLDVMRFHYGLEFFLGSYLVANL